MAAMGEQEAATGLGWVRRAGGSDGLQQLRKEWGRHPGLPCGGIGFLKPAPGLVHLFWGPGRRAFSPLTCMVRPGPVLRGHGLQGGLGLAARALPLLQPLPLRPQPLF